MAKSGDVGNGNDKVKNWFAFFHKQWWIKFEHNYDGLMKKHLWNKKVKVSSYKKTDFIEQVASDRDKLVDCIMFISSQRSGVTSQFLTLNSALMSVYGYGATQTDWFHHLIMIITFFVISIAACFAWIAKIHSCIQFNTACFAAVRQYQEYLPSKPHGDALVKVLYESSQTVFRPVLEAESWLPRIFFIWYTMLFFYNLWQYFFS